MHNRPHAQNLESHLFRFRWMKQGSQVASICPDSSYRKELIPLTKGVVERVHVHLKTDLHEIDFLLPGQLCKRISWTQL